MLKSFGNINDLLVAVEADKHYMGANAGTADRFPIRFVLFDNFRDSYQFISNMSDRGIAIQSVDKWMDPQYDDMFISRIELADNIVNHLEEINGEDCVIAPFSELARFYDNIELKEFDALITTLKAVQTSNIGYAKHQRVYIVVVGQYGKISNFENDPQMFIWYLKSEDRQLTYRLVLANGTDYNVCNLNHKFTVVRSLKDWLYLWRNETNIKSTIISTSPSLFAYEQNALPDNAFNFDKCENVYKFLTLGLGLTFGNVRYEESDDAYWKVLAEKIDVSNFSFSEFIKQYFQLFELKDHRDFIKAWYDTTVGFDRWLLVTYYMSEFDNTDYLYIALSKCRSYTDRELFEQLMVSIFDYENYVTYIGVRAKLLKLMKYGCLLSKDAQMILETKLQKTAEHYGYNTAASLLTSCSNTEREIAIRWLGEGHIADCDIRENFPDFYVYLHDNNLPIKSQPWLEGYFDKYKRAKFTNAYDQDLNDILKNHSSNEVAFYKWYQDFSTVRSLLSDRQDIEIFYWIDGLGVEWIPVVRRILEKEKANDIYLNEVIVGKALLPSTTSRNSVDLEKLVPYPLIKTGDLDSFAHKTNNKYPEYIVEEFEIIKKAIHSILSEYAGKKIAIVSDHGLTHLSQFCKGLNLVGFESDHHGRLAKRIGSTMTHDDRYVVIDDSIACALGHNSLCGKVPTGQGAHGGATPEEVLVPIFIISNQQSANSWDVSLITKDISATQPIVKFAIKGLGSELPGVVYNGKSYKLVNVGGCEYHSSKIDLVANVTEIILCIGSYEEKFQLNLNLGAVEEDLF